MPKTLTIKVEDSGTFSMQASDPIALDDLLTILMSTALGAMNNIVKSAPKDKEEECRGTLYDLFNVAASKVLQNFAPELELHPNLTALAIKEAEDRIILEGRLGEVAAGS